MSTPQAKKEKELKRKEELAKAARAAKEEAKKLKKEQQKEEQRKKSAAGSKIKKPAIGLDAILQAEKEIEESLKIRRIKEEDILARDTRGAANGTGDEILFEKKLTKEEKKALAATKRAEKAAAAAANNVKKGGNKTNKNDTNSTMEDNEKGDGLDETNDTPTNNNNPPNPPLIKNKKAVHVINNKKLSALSRVEQQKEDLEIELEEAKIKAATSRNLLGAYKGAIEASSFTLPNPGGGANLLEDAACTLVRGKCYGLIGRNGKGKSTMLRAFAARRVGNVPSNVTVHYVTQDVHLTQSMSKMTPVEIVVLADIELRLLLSESKELDELAEKGELDEIGQIRQVEVLERLEMIESDSAERRADELLINLGFSDELRSRQMSELSGGWRVRTMLAAAIFARPDMLLLDEPTNHLSITAVLWLARELKESPVWRDRIIIIVSHDRYFLDEVCTDVLHISGAARRLTQSHGNYTTWSIRRSEQQQLFEKETVNRQNEIDKMKEFSGHGFKYGGSSNAINKMKMLEKQASKLEIQANNQAEESAALQEDIELPLIMKSGGELPGFIVQMKQVAFGYPGSKCLFSDADFSVTSKSRIVLLGENGNGKTTLVKLMLGELMPTKGEVLIKSNARVALVNQHHAEQIDLDLTPLQYMTKLFPAPEGTTGFDHLQRLRSHLASCGVTGGSSTKSANGNQGSALGLNQILDLQNTPAQALSGGQRSRVAMAAVSFLKPHVLVLDEPTNNLDLESVGALAESVKKFDGAVIVVSHDQFFVNEIANEAWVVGKGKVQRVESFEAYRNKELNKLKKTSV
mmetsp:Transcript_28411/g.36747  ORF Transcript_28411/g.36747 Transcript_28411/m.36747 type:complete len:806 (-) Transcript_28411:246-2663(-)